MTFLNSEKAKAELVAAFEKEQAVQKAQDKSPIQSLRSIKAFWAQQPKTRDLFGVIMTMWRKSMSRRPDYEGYWAAYPYRDWSELTGMPDRTLKRHLKLLEQHA